MIRALIIGAAAIALATPAIAQTSPSWTGLYVGGRIGYVKTPQKTSDSVLFDNNLDGQFGDTVRTASGVNAFSPGFCNGAGRTALAVDRCETDNDGLTYGIHAGADYQFGQIVVGGLVEYDRAKVENGVTAFTVTPASYTLTRELRGTLAARARIGLDLQGTLPYLTAGIVRAKVRNSFSTTNTVNAFAPNGGGRQSGYRLGGGFEQRIGPLSLGVLYLYTNVKDDDFRVNVTRGTAPATNAFILTNPAGTQFRFSDKRFETHSANLTASYRF